MNYFYAKYIFMEEFLTQLHGLDLTDEERSHLASLVDSSLHHAILDEILSNLKDDDKKLFLRLLEEDPHNEKLMEFLKSRVENIEERIKKVSADLIKEMHEDVKKAKLK